MMKKIALFTALMLCIVASAEAHRHNDHHDRYDGPELKQKYINLSFSSLKFEEPRAGHSLGRSKWGVALTSGRSFKLHKRPIADMLFIGIDLDGGFDYNQYRENWWSNENVHQMDFSLGVGPSIHVMPVGELGIHAYIRYNPAFSFFIGGDEGWFMPGFASLGVAGAAVSWNVISIGIEGRWGAGWYNTPSELIRDINENVSSRKRKFSGFRAYFGFRF